jgi:hypothetical protein
VHGSSYRTFTRTRIARLCLSEEDYAKKRDTPHSDNCYSQNGGPQQLIYQADHGFYACIN